MTEKKIYVCYTVMHVYVTLLKVYNDNIKNNNILILTDHISDYKIIESKINELKIFDQVIIVEDHKLNERFQRNKWNLFFYKKNLIKFFDKETELINLRHNENMSVNIYLDSTRTSHYFMLLFDNINLIEDGLSLYTNKKMNFREVYKKYVARMPKSFGFDDSITTIEGTHPDKLPIGIKQKAKMLDLDLLKKNLNESDKDTIIHLFLEEKNVKFTKNKKILVLTGPYSEEKIISEDHKLNLYKKIIEPYQIDYDIYIKPHPREKTNYLALVGSNITVLNKNYPIELLDLVLYEPFDKCITIDSSALKNLTCVKEKIMLGLDYDTKLFIEYYKKSNVKK